ncbi:MAG: copper-binding protein, partial [Alphaproteobacteria bacterium]|nr:copper-binding protein [Alphaproteobacteria bacterium]
ELRDRVVMGTGSGASFMGWFNDIYYSFSPAVADMQREHPVLREVVRASLVPLVSSLSLLHHADIETDVEMIGYGVSLIVLNIGMYGGVPMLSIVIFRKRRNGEVRS